MKYQDVSVARGIMDFTTNLQDRHIQTSKWDKRSIMPLVMKISCIAINRLPVRKSKVEMYTSIALLRARLPSGMKTGHLVGYVTTF